MWRLEGLVLADSLKVGHLNSASNVRVWPKLFKRLKIELGLSLDLFVSAKNFRGKKLGTSSGLFKAYLHEQWVICRFVSRNATWHTVRISSNLAVLCCATWSDTKITVRLNRPFASTLAAFCKKRCSRNALSRKDNSLKQFRLSIRQAVKRRNITTAIKFIKFCTRVWSLAIRGWFLIRLVPRLCKQLVISFIPIYISKESFCNKLRD
jgi:hypothetical protein